MSILVLISGSGTNLQALIDAELPGKICKVISSSATAYGLERAAKAGIPTAVHSLQSYFSGIPKEDKSARAEARNKFNLDLAKQIIEEKPKLVVCAGWMLVLNKAFLEELEKSSIKIINLHPALPNSFPGIHAIERAWEAGNRGEVTKGGVMIHYVIPDVDMGSPLVVREIDFIKGESVESYEARVHAVEHEAIVEGTKLAYASIQ